MQAAVAAERAKGRRRIVECAETIAAKVEADPDRRTRRELFVSMRRWRDVFDMALNRAIAESLVIEEMESGQGVDRRALRPGTATGAAA